MRRNDKLTDLRKDRLIEEMIVYTRGVANLRSVEGPFEEKTPRALVLDRLIESKRNEIKSIPMREKDRDVVSEWEKVRLRLFIGFERRDFSVPWALLHGLAVTRAVNNFWGVFEFILDYLREFNFYTFFFERRKNFINIVTKINKNMNRWYQISRPRPKRSTTLRVIICHPRPNLQVWQETKYEKSFGTKFILVDLKTEHRWAKSPNNETNPIQYSPKQNKTLGRRVWKHK